jgi:hypothetical protein
MALDAEGLKLRFGITEARCGAGRETALEPGDRVRVEREVDKRLQAQLAWLTTGAPVRWVPAT